MILSKVCIGLLIGLILGSKQNRTSKGEVSWSLSQNNPGREIRTAT